MKAGYVYLQDIYWRANIRGLVGNLYLNELTRDCRQILLPDLRMGRNKFADSITFAQHYQLDAVRGPATVAGTANSVDCETRIRWAGSFTYTRSYFEGSKRVRQPLLNTNDVQLKKKVSTGYPISDDRAMGRLNASHLVPKCPTSFCFKRLHDRLRRATSSVPDRTTNDIINVKARSSIGVEESGGPYKVTNAVYLADFPLNTRKVSVAHSAVGAYNDLACASKNDYGSSLKPSGRQKHRKQQEAEYVRLGGNGPLVLWANPKTGNTIWYVAMHDVDVSNDGKHWFHFAGVPCQNDLQNYSSSMQGRRRDH